MFVLQSTVVFPAEQKEFVRVKNGLKRGCPTESE
jgi:hypothetical protein